MEKVRPWCGQPSVGSRTAKEQNRFFGPLVSRPRKLRELQAFVRRNASSLQQYYNICDDLSAWPMRNRTHAWHGPSQLCNIHRTPAFRSADCTDGSAAKSSGHGSR